MLDEEKVESYSHFSGPSTTVAGGVCPFISSKLTDPSNEYFEEGYNMEYNCKYTHFLNQRSIAPPSNLKEEEDEKEGASIKDDTQSNQGFKPLSSIELQQRQKVLLSYPQILINTLFHEHKKYAKLRSIEFSKMFFFSDEVKAMGNETYKKNDLYLALDYYEHCLTLYTWIEMKDELLKEKPFTIFGLDPIQITDDAIINQFKIIDSGITDELLENENCKRFYFDDLIIVMTVIINIMANAFVVYMKLFHFTEAKKCAQYILNLRSDYIKGYVMLGQSIYFKKEATFKEIEEAQEIVKSGFKYALKQENVNQLSKIEELLQMKMNIKIKRDVQQIEQIVNKAKKIYDLKVSKNLSVNVNNRSESSRNEGLRIAEMMHKKYFDVLEYFRESQEPQNVTNTILEFQKFDETYQQMKELNELNFQSLDAKVLLELPEALIELIKSNETILLIANELRVKEVNEIFQNSKHINLELMKHSMNLCDKEEEKRKKQEDKVRKLKESQNGLLATRTYLLSNAVGVGILFILWLIFRNDIQKYMRVSN